MPPLLRSRYKIIPRREEVYSPAVPVHSSASPHVWVSVWPAQRLFNPLPVGSWRTLWGLSLSEWVLGNRVSMSKSYLRLFSGFYSLWCGSGVCIACSSAASSSRRSLSLSLKQTGQGSSCAELGFKGTGATQHSTHTHKPRQRRTHTLTDAPARPWRHSARPRNSLTAQTGTALFSRLRVDVGRLAHVSASSVYFWVRIESSLPSCVTAGLSHAVWIRARELKIVMNPTTNILKVSIAVFLPNPHKTTTTARDSSEAACCD